jgi:hypothetical protein
MHLHALIILMKIICLRGFGTQLRSGLKDFDSLDVLVPIYGPKYRKVAITLL